jgi:hypothetical protein
MEDGEDQPIGTSRVITSLTGEQLVELSNGEGIAPNARLKWPKVTATAGRFVTSIVMRREGVPEALAKESFIASKRQTRFDPRRPVVHLQRSPLPVTAPNQPQRKSVTDGTSVSPLETTTEGTPNHELLSAEILLPLRGPLTLLEAREAVLATLREQLPFFERHVVAIDSLTMGFPFGFSSKGFARKSTVCTSANRCRRANP